MFRIYKIYGRRVKKETHRVVNTKDTQDLWRRSKEHTHVLYIFLVVLVTCSLASGSVLYFTTTTVRFVR